MVFGSGRTWPQDFRFLVGFFSVPVEAGSRVDEVFSPGVDIDITEVASVGDVALGVESTSSCFESVEKAAGVMSAVGVDGISLEAEVVENNEG